MFETGTVVASYPEGMSVDVLLDDGSRLSNVQVLSPSASSSTGMIDLPDVGGPADDTRWDPTVSRTRYVKAMVGFCRGVPFVAGFLLPQVNQITFQEKNRRIVKHASDVYTSIDDAGNLEVYHPSGTYLRIGESSAHEDLTAKDFDKRFAVARNTTKAVYVKLRVANAGDDKASIEITPQGHVTLQCDGNLAAAVGGTTSVASSGAAALQAPSVTVTSPESTFTGHVTIQGGLAVSGGSGASVTGNINVTSGNVVADGIGLKTHRHTEQGDGQLVSTPVA